MFVEVSWRAPRAAGRFTVICKYSSVLLQAKWVQMCQLLTQRAPQWLHSPFLFSHFEDQRVEC